MKRCVHIIFSVFLVMCMFTCSAAAESYSSYRDIDIVYFNDGTYLEITTTSSNILGYSNTKNSSKEYTYKSSTGKTILIYTLYGTFSYNGTTSKALDAYSEIDIYQPGWDVSDHEESYSGNTVRGTAVFSGPSGDKTLGGSITCDKNGNIS